jgi:hypothetical protein
MVATENILSLVGVLPIFYQRTGCFFILFDKKVTENPELARDYQAFLTPKVEILTMGKANGI